MADYTSTVSNIPYGTTFTVSISPSVGYHNGTLNISNGTVISDVTVQATSAISYRWSFTLNLAQSGNRYGYRDWGGEHFGAINGLSGWNVDDFYCNINNGALSSISFCVDDGSTPTYNLPAIYFLFPDGTYLQASQNAYRTGNGSEEDFLCPVYTPNSYAIGQKVLQFAGQNITVYLF